MKGLMIFVLACLSTFILSSVDAQDNNALFDKFYSEIAEIVERNMDNPDACVKEAENYYKTHQKEVDQIRTATEKAMQQAAPYIQEHLNNYMSMSEKEAEALAKKYEGMQGSGKSKMSPAAQKYSEALSRFSMKHPAWGMKVATLAMQLMPKLNQTNLGEGGIPTQDIPQEYESDEQP